MMMRRAVVLLVAVCAVACATSGAPAETGRRRTPLRRSHPRRKTSNRRTTAELSKRSTTRRGPRRKPVAEPKVDVERSHTITIPITGTIPRGAAVFHHRPQPSIRIADPLGQIQELDRQALGRLQASPCGLAYCR